MNILKKDGGCAEKVGGAREKALQATQRAPRGTASSTFEANTEHADNGGGERWRRETSPVTLRSPKIKS